MKSRLWPSRIFSSNPARPWSAAPQFSPDEICQVQQALIAHCALSLKRQGDEGQSGGALEDEAAAKQSAGNARPFVPVTVQPRNAPFIGRQNTAQTAAVLHAGTVRGSGVEFWPEQVASTRIGPVSGGGTGENPDRLSVIAGQSMTVNRIAGSQAGAGGPSIPSALDRDSGRPLDDATRGRARSANLSRRPGRTAIRSFRCKGRPGTRPCRNACVAA
jgi:hypothetical protein